MLFLFFQVIRKQYEDKKWNCEYSCMFNFAEEEKLLIPEKFFSEVKGWTVMQGGQPEVKLNIQNAHHLNFYMQIPFGDFKYWEICDNNVENLKRFEKDSIYPPRFRIRCFKKVDNMMVDLCLRFDVIKKSKNNDTSCIGRFFLVKKVTNDKLANGKKLCYGYTCSGLHGLLLHACLYLAICVVQSMVIC